MKHTLGLQQGEKEASEAGDAKGLPPSSFLELGAGRPQGSSSWVCARERAATALHLLSGWQRPL